MKWVLHRTSHLLHVVIEYRSRTLVDSEVYFHHNTVRSTVSHINIYLRTCHLQISAYRVCNQLPHTHMQHFLFHTSFQIVSYHFPLLLHSSHMLNKPKRRNSPLFRQFCCFSSTIQF